MGPSVLLAIILLLPCLYDLLPRFSVVLPSSPFFYFSTFLCLQFSPSSMAFLDLSFSLALFFSLAHSLIVCVTAFLLWGASPSVHLTPCFFFFFLSLAPNLFIFTSEERSHKSFDSIAANSSNSCFCRVKTGNSNHLAYPRLVAYAVFSCFWKPTGFTLRVFIKAPTEKFTAYQVGGNLPSALYD